MRIDTTKITYYKTNAGMGPKQYGYFLAITENLLLCVDIVGEVDVYKIGHFLSDFEWSDMIPCEYNPMVSPLFETDTLGMVLDYLEPVTHEAIERLGWRYIGVASDGGTKTFQKNKFYGLEFSGDNGYLKHKNDPRFYEIEIFKVSAKMVSDDGRNFYKTYNRECLFKGIVKDLGFLKQVIASVMPLTKQS